MKSKSHFNVTQIVTETPIIWPDIDLEDTITFPPHKTSSNSITHQDFRKKFGLRSGNRFCAASYLLRCVQRDAGEAGPARPSGGGGRGGGRPAVGEESERRRLTTSARRARGGGTRRRRRGTGRRGKSTKKEHGTGGRAGIRRRRRRRRYRLPALSSRVVDRKRSVFFFLAGANRPRCDTVDDHCSLAVATRFLQRAALPCSSCPPARKSPVQST